MKESVMSSRRQGITHFQQMKPEEFVYWMRSVREKHGVLKDIKAVMKVDGLGARFGKDAHGRTFFEGSRSGPVFDSNAFSAFARAKTDDAVVIERATHYDRMFEIIKTAPLIEELPDDSKIVCEIFYTPMSKEHLNGGVIFVHVAYDRRKLGTEVTILPYTVLVSSTGEEHPEKNQILEAIYAKSNDRIKILNPNLTFNPIDVAMFAEQASAINDDALALVKSRKSCDREARLSMIDRIQKIKDALADYLLGHPGIEGKFRLGPEIEGVVLHIPQTNGVIPFKITTPEFKASLKDPTRHAPKGTTEHELFLGRMQPLHRKHQQIIQSMKNPIVVIVKGESSSQDRDRNPLDADTQCRLLHKACPGVEVSVSPDGFLPGILGYLRKKGKEVVSIYCGADRIQEYSAAIERANRQMDQSLQYTVKFEETERYMSATRIRQAIRENDIDTFKQLTPEVLWDEWDTLRSLMCPVQEDVVTTGSIEITDKPLLPKKKPKKVKSFKEFLSTSKE
jgi:hypothetical protein